MIYDCFRVTGAGDTVFDFADLFSTILRNDNVQDFDTRWCSKGGPVQFLRMSDDRALKPTPKAAPPSEPSMTRGRSASRKRCVRGRSQTYHFVSIGILPNVNSTKLNQDAKQETSGLDDMGAVAIGLCLASLRTIRTSEKREVSEKPDAESFGIN